jgi:hypothetical protein
MAKKREPAVEMPLQLPSTMSLYEKESREADAKLAEMKKKAKTDRRRKIAAKLP